MKSNKNLVAPTAICAALYVASIVATTPIPTPWGVGHFRPGVVIPAFFAVISGPYVAAVGAAIGTFIGDLFLSSVGLSNPLLSLIAGVPGNFVGFFVLGWLMKRSGTWKTFIYASVIAVLVGNIVAATGVVGFFSLLVGGPMSWTSWPIEVKLATIFGFTFFWTATMIPFVIPLVPLLVRAVLPLARRSRVVVDISRWQPIAPTKLLPLSILISLLLGIVFVGIVFTPLGDLMFSRIIVPENALWVKVLILVASLSILIFGPLTSSMATAQPR